MGIAILSLLKINLKSGFFWAAVLPLGYWACCVIWALASYAKVLSVIVPLIFLVSLVILIIYVNRIRRINTNSKFPYVILAFAILTLVITVIYAPERGFIGKNQEDQIEIQCYWDHLHHVGQLFELLRGTILETNGVQTQMTGSQVVDAVWSQYTFFYYFFAPLIVVFHLDIHSLYFGFGMWWMRIMLMLALAAVGYSFHGKRLSSIMIPLFAFVIYIPNLLRSINHQLFLLDWDNTLWNIIHSPSAGAGNIIFILSIALLFFTTYSQKEISKRVWFFSGLLVISLFKFRAGFFLIAAPTWLISTTIWLFIKRAKLKLWLYNFLLAVLAISIISQPLLYKFGYFPSESGKNAAKLIGFDYGLYPDYLLRHDKKDRADFDPLIPNILRIGLYKLPHLVRVPATTIIWMIGKLIGLFAIPCLFLIFMKKAWSPFSRSLPMPVIFGIVLFFTLFLWDVLVTHPGYGRFSPWQVTASPNYLMSIYALIIAGFACTWIFERINITKNNGHFNSDSKILLNIRWNPEIKIFLIFCLIIFLLAHSFVLFGSAYTRRGSSGTVESEVLESLNFLRANTSPNAVILADKFWKRQELINGIAGRRTVLSRYSSTKVYYPKEARKRRRAIKAFWNASVKEKGRLKIIYNYGVTHILDFSGSLVLVESRFLKEVKRWNEIVLYEVKKVEDYINS